MSSSRVPGGSQAWLPSSPTDMNPHKSRNSGFLEVLNGAVESPGCSQWRLGDLKWRLRGPVPVTADSYNFDEEQDPDSI
jgi:hypothetical protein